MLDYQFSHKCLAKSNEVLVTSFSKNLLPVICTNSVDIKRVCIYENFDWWFHWSFVHSPAVCNGHPGPKVTVQSAPPAPNSQLCYDEYTDRTQCTVHSVGRWDDEAENWPPTLVCRGYENEVASTWYPRLLPEGVIHLWRPQENRAFDPRSPCLHTSTCAWPLSLVGVHTPSTWNTHRSLETASTMTFRTESWNAIKMSL